MIKIRDEDNMYPMNCYKCNNLMEIINRPKKQDDDRIDLLCLNCNTEHVYLLDKKISIAYIPEVQNEGDKTMSKKYDEPDTSTYNIHESGHVIEKPPAPTPQFTKEIQNQNKPNTIKDYIDKAAIYEKDGMQTLPRVGIPEQPTHFKFKDIYKTTVRISKINVLSIEKNGDLCPDDKYYIYICNMNIDVEYRSEKLRDQEYKDLTDILTGLTK